MSAQVEGQWGTARGAGVGARTPGRGRGLTRSTPTCASSSSGRVDVTTQWDLPTVLDPEQAEKLRGGVAERALRIPLQHVTGRMFFRSLVLTAMPGVFIVRPETEVLAGLAIDEARSVVGTAARRASSTCAPAPGRSRWPLPPRPRAPKCGPSKRNRILSPWPAITVTVSARAACTWNAATQRT